MRRETGGGVPEDGASDRADVQLVRLVADGDCDALAELYQRHSKMLFGQILLVAGERTLSEEILQDTMLAIWRGARFFRAESQVRSWMIAIARRQARDRMRRRRPQAVDDAVLAEFPSAEPDPESVALERAEAAAVADAIKTLSPSHREVLGLTFGSGLSLPQVAEVLGIPLGTVKSRLTAARAGLARSLRNEGYNR